MERYSAQLQPGYWRHVFGDRWTFAIEMECEVEAPQRTTWGALWLWVDGLVVGNTDHWEHLGIGSSWLNALGEGALKRPNRVFKDYSPSLRLETFIWWYQECEWNAPVENWNAEGLDPYDYFVSPSCAGPAFDNWWAIIARQGDKEIITWKESGHSKAYEFELQAGYFGDVCSSAYLFLRGNEPEVL